MCRDCGCAEASQEHEHWIDGKLVRHSHGPDSAHAHTPHEVHAHAPHAHETSRHIHLEESVLAKNDRIANENRAWFEQNKIRVLNLISSPGSGKTLLLEKTMALLGADFKVSLITADQEQDFDALRIRRAGGEVLQLHTHSSCHLDASMIAKELGKFVRPTPGLLIIENVGNLVCPASFDLGETQKVALLSCTEGEDKPSKYPLLFHEAAMIVITKIDLLPHLDWDLSLCETHIRKLNANAPILKLSARTGEGLEAWMQFIRSGQISKL